MVYSGIGFYSRASLYKSGCADKSNVSVNLIAEKYSSFRSKRLYFRQIKRLFADIAKEEHSLSHCPIFILYTPQILPVSAIFFFFSVFLTLLFFSKFSFATLYIPGVDFKCSFPTNDAQLALRV